MTGQPKVLSTSAITWGGKDAEEERMKRRRLDLMIS
jgi:hypothetical protein